ncbi:MAG: ATP-dependent DNA helicase RecG [Acidobacteria bacterium RIFCSPLOWO2_02_FULL_61_28]|nr:MAG: ATP-dependent DNA helicase RecG [Acidobacteria bacterium RIFCSPLOWO2_02_FULL_61_28]
MITLGTAVQFVKGVGEQRAAILHNKGIATVEDLLYYLPFRYEDRTRLRGPSEVRAGEMATVIAKVRSAGMLPVRRGSVSIFCADVGERGSYLRCKWFHAAYLERIIKPGQYLALHGKVETDPYEAGLVMLQPQYEILPELDGGLTPPLDSARDKLTAGGITAAGHSLEVGRIVPIYEAMGKGRLTSRFFRRVIHTALESLAGVEDPLPPSVTGPLGLLPRWEAIRNAHFPAPGSRLTELDSFRSPAQVRLIFEEFFLLETGLALKRKRARERPGIAFRADAHIRECLKRILPFHPTAAQKRALGEIVEDMRAPRPMHRLLQGDVGSGKTIVALQAAVIAIENGFQVAMMAPTEILAAQHFLCFRHFLARSGYTPVLLSGSATPREKKAVKKLLREGAAQIAVGTHALVEGDVEFKALGLVVIDEQHRFGVMQRLRLMQKSQSSSSRGAGTGQAGLPPDTLVMTATPIPRTLALTIYGDLDVSVIDELPAGRRPVLTRQLPEEASSQAYKFVRSQVASGAQAFIVCPVIEDGSSLEGEETKPTPRAGSGELKSALKMFEFLSKEVFPEFRVGLLHGRMPTEDKEKTMGAFQSGAISILVGTTVIEVGVDMPNATVMVVQQAERFGLAQLHQLRGRVGRGRRQSHCLLLTSRQQTEAARQRLSTLERTHNGFEIAELDLRLRGPGEFMGTRQSGLPALRVANLLRDREILEKARRLAMDFVEQGDRRELAHLVSYIKESWNRRYGLVTVG